MSLSSRTHFEVLGLEGRVLSLGLEASSPRKLPCPRLENSTVFWIVKLMLINAINLAETLRSPFLFSSFGDRLKKIFEYFFFRRTPALVSLVLGREHSCSWPREGLSLALDFLCSWPWTRALCPRLHLWLLITKTKGSFLKRVFLHSKHNACFWNKHFCFGNKNFLFKAKFLVGLPLNKT